MRDRNKNMPSGVYPHKHSSFRGKKHTEEAKEKNRIAHQFTSDDTRAKMSLSAKERGPSFIGKRHTEETKKKISLSRFGLCKGEKNPRWVADRTVPLEKHRLRGTQEWKNWRGEVFERDRYTCRNCGMSGVYLEPHHIEPLRQALSRAFEVNNGITLCRPCHQKTIWKEEQFAEGFSQLIATQKA